MSKSDTTADRLTHSFTFDEADEQHGLNVIIRVHAMGGMARTRAPATIAVRNCSQALPSKVGIHVS